MSDIERLATELAALPEWERRMVLQRMRALGTQAQAVGQRLGSRNYWADLVGSHLYDSYGNAVAIVHNVKMDLQSAAAPDYQGHEWLTPAVQRTTIEITAYGIKEDK